MRRGEPTHDRAVRVRSRRVDARVSCLAVGFAWFLAGAHVRAQPPVDDRTFIDEALREWEAGRWDEARGLFRAAYAASPNARTMRAIAMASFELRDYPAAYRALLIALEESHRPLDEAQRSEALSLLERVHARIGVFSLVGVPDEAVLDVDGTSVSVGPDEPLVLGLGEHRIRATHEGVETTRSITVVGGEHVALSFAEPTAIAADATSRPLTSDDASSPRLGRRAAFVVLGSGASVVAGAGVLLALGVRDDRRVERAPDGTEWSSLARADERGPKLVRASLALGAAGLVAVSIGTVYVRADARRRVTVQASAFPAGIHVGGAF